MKTWAEINATIAAVRAAVREADPFAGLSPGHRSVYDALVRAANVGDRCPTDVTLCELAGCASPSTPRRALRQLDELGVITIIGGGRHRQVIITSTRKATAPIVRCTRDHGDNYGRRKARMEAGPAQPVMVRVVDRTPCQRCGVRGDLGCVHRAASEPQLVAA